jgi:hypothetical protein
MLISLIDSSEFARFHESKGSMEGFQYFPALRLRKHVHRQALKGAVQDLMSQHSFKFRRLERIDERGISID